MLGLRLRLDPTYKLEAARIIWMLGRRNGYVSKGDALAFAVSALFAAVGLFAAFLGEMPWWPGIFFATCAAALVLSHFLVDLPMDVDDLEVSARGVRRAYGPRWLAKQVEAVSWDGLSKVEIMTTNLGPHAEDMFFLLYGADDGPVTVSNALAEEHGLLEELQRRLPGFDNRRVVEACGSVDNARFLVWQRPASRQCDDANGGPR